MVHATAPCRLPFSSKPLQPPPGKAGGLDAPCCGLFRILDQKSRLFPGKTGPPQGISLLFSFHAQSLRAGSGTTPAAEKRTDRNLSAAERHLWSGQSNLAL